MKIQCNKCINPNSPPLMAPGCTMHTSYNIVLFMMLVSDIAGSPSLDWLSCPSCRFSASHNTLPCQIWCRGSRLSQQAGVRGSGGGFSVSSMHHALKGVTNILNVQKTKIFLVFIFVISLMTPYLQILRVSEGIRYADAALKDEREQNFRRSRLTNVWAMAELWNVISLSTLHRIVFFFRTVNNCNI